MTSMHQPQPEVNPRRSSKSGFACSEAVQPESVVALVTELLRLGGLSEDALWASCTLLEKLAEKARDKS